MSTITLYKNKVNGVGGLLDDIIKSIDNLDVQLGTLKNTLQGVDSSTCNLQDTVDSISSSSKSEEEKVEDLKKLNGKLSEFIETTTKRDNSARDIINEEKKEFYSEYSYLKPECEKSWTEKVADGLKKIGEWCKEHWKEILIVLEVVIAVVCLFIPGLQGLGISILTGMLKGMLIGAVIGGISGYAQYGVEGILGGALEGAKGGALLGGAFGALGSLGSTLGTVVKCSGALTGIFATSTVLSFGMIGFDMLALVDMTCMRLEMDTGIQFGNEAIGIGTGFWAGANQKAHSNKAYNVFQTFITATSIFTGGMMKTASCFVAGTMILTASGLMAIERIKAGDKVISTNPNTMETSEKTVLETYIREVEKLVHLTINGEEIITTVDHPFYVKNKGFVNAVNLCIGTELLDVNGNILRVEQIYREHLENKTVKVYNFQVEDFHTYHVGYNEVWVHNAGADYSGKRAEIVKQNSKTGKAFEKDNFSKLKSAHPEAETQVSVKPMDSRGNPMRKGGNYLDGISLDSNGKPIITEYKASTSAPYTSNQTSNGFKNGALNKDMVVVGEGKGIFKPGDVIPTGTPVDTIRGK